MLKFVARFYVTKRLTILVVLIFALTVLFAACSPVEMIQLPVLADYDVQTDSEKRTSLRLGVVSGPYEAMFRDVIMPLYAEKGYQVELVVYGNYTDPNFALANGDIDLNMFQHYVYLNNFKFENDLNLSAIAEIPTASMGIYSSKLAALDVLVEGASVAIPADPTNLARALRVLDSARIIYLDQTVDPLKVTLEDVKSNPYKLKFYPMQAQQLVSALDTYSLAVINGNYALNGGLSLSDALFNETLAAGYVNVVAVRAEDLGEPFVLDLINILRSDAFKDVIKDEEGKYSSFQYPHNFLSLSFS